MDKFIEYAPLLVVVTMFITQNHMYVKPEELEKKHREILEDCEKKFVSWSAHRDLKHSFEDMKDKIDKIFDILITRKEDE